MNGADAPMIRPCFISRSEELRKTSAWPVSLSRSSRLWPMLPLDRICERTGRRREWPRPAPHATSGLYGFEEGCVRFAGNYAANALRATPKVSSMSCAVCAADTNPASNADGAR